LAGKADLLAPINPHRLRGEDHAVGGVVPRLSARHAYDRGDGKAARFEKTEMRGEINFEGHRLPGAYPKRTNARVLWGGDRPAVEIADEEIHPWNPVLGLQDEITAGMVGDGVDGDDRFARNISAL